jgi:two-component system nitrogen regulation sensor histidine kinase GlnL
MARDLTGVLDAVLTGVVVLDADGRVEFLNTAACRILETSDESARGVAVEGLLGPGHAVARLARAVLASGGSAVENACPVERRFEPDTTVDVAASPLFDPTGRVDGVAVVLRDSTLRQSLQDFVAQRDALAAFGRIAAGVAHEVKNPLGGIRGAAEILASRAGDAKTLDAAELIVREVDRIAALVDDLMVFTQGELRVGPVNVHRVLDDVLALASHDRLAKGVPIERAYDPSIPETLADADRLTQVLLNLVRNALQAMEGREGRLTVATRMTLEHRLRAPTGEQVPTLAIEVRDTGPGIAPEVLEQLATPFFTTRPGGTGLGLAVARHWVARHGGTLQLESDPGAGTCVRVVLPLRRAR